MCDRTGFDREGFTMSSEQVVDQVAGALGKLGGRARVRDIHRELGMNISTVKKTLRAHPGRFEKDAEALRIVYWKLRKP